MMANDKELSHIENDESTLSASETKEFVEDGEIDFDSDVMETETSSPKEIVSVPIVPSLEQNNIKTRKIKRKTKTHKRKNRNDSRTPSPQQQEQQIFIETTNNDEIDELEATWIRGGSPTPAPVYTTSREIYDNYDDDDRQPFKKKRKHRHYFNDDTEQYNNTTSIENYDLQSQRHQVCKFYVQGRCIKRKNCTYMHDEFPCKFYYLGINHPNNNNNDTLNAENETFCKFSHGPPLEALQLRKMLFKHITTAPSDILGDFPQLTLKEVQQKFDAQHLVLMKKYDKNVNMEQQSFSSSSSSTKIKRTRWSPASSSKSTTNSNTLDELHDILLPEQIDRLTSNGIECVEQIFDMTLTQLTKIGLNVMEMHDLQMKILSARKEGNDDNNGNEKNQTNVIINDIDMRQSCSDIDMRQLPKNDDTIGNLMQAFTPIVKVHYTDFVNGIDGSDNNVQKNNDINLSNHNNNWDTDDENNLIINEDCDMNTKKPLESKEVNAIENCAINVPETNIRSHAIGQMSINNIEPLDLTISSSHLTDKNSIMQSTFHIHTPPSREEYEVYESNMEKEVECNIPNDYVIDNRQQNFPSREEYEVYDSNMDRKNIFVNDCNIDEPNVQQNFAKRDENFDKNLQRKPHYVAQNEYKKNFHHQEIINFKRTMSEEHRDDNEPFIGFENCCSNAEIWQPHIKSVPTAINTTKNEEENWDNDIEEMNVPLEEIGNNLSYIRPQFPFEPNTQLCGASEINASLTSHQPKKYHLQLIDIPASYSYRNLIGKIKLPTGYLDPRLIAHQQQYSITPLPSSILIDRNNVDPRIRAKQQQQQQKPNNNPFSNDPTITIKTTEWYQHLNMADKMQLNDRLTFAAYELMQYRQQLLLSFNDIEKQQTIDLNAILQMPIFYQLYQDYNIGVNENGQFIRVCDYIRSGQKINHTIHRMHNNECYYFEMGYQLHPNNIAYGQTAINFNVQSRCNDGGNVLTADGTIAKIDEMQYQPKPYQLDTGIPYQKPW